MWGRELETVLFVPTLKVRRIQLNMNKRLKLSVLASSKRTKSVKKEIPDAPSCVLSETSEYFHDSSDKKPKTEAKKRGPVKIEYDAGPNTVKIENDTKSSEKWEPAEWRVVLNNIKEMRKGLTAPVDEMGCHMCADPNAAASVIRFQSLVALMLSSQTKDQVTHAAMQRLREHGCTPQNIINTPDSVLGELIYPVGFYKRKVEYIKKTADILNEQYAGDIPRTLEGLCKLPGVGPKMAHICMQIAWGEVSGIGVDTHVHRISNRLGWLQTPSKTPEQTRVGLEKWLPKEEWTDVNYLLVGFGQEICLPLRPKCEQCLNKNICPYNKNNKTSEGGSSHVRSPGKKKSP